MMQKFVLPYFADFTDFLIYSTMSKIGSLHFDSSVNTQPIEPIVGQRMFEFLDFSYADSTIFFTLRNTQRVYKVQLATRTIVNISEAQQRMSFCRF